MAAGMEVSGVTAVIQADPTLGLRRGLIGVRAAQIACSVVLMIFSGIGSGLGVLIGLGYDYWEPLGTSLMILFMASANLALSIAFLVYTAAPRRRGAARSCFNPNACTWYTCDLAWDIVFGCFWLAMLILAALSDSVGTAVVSGVLFALLAASAGMAGKIHRLNVEAAASTKGSSAITGEAAA